MPLTPRLLPSPSFHFPPAVTVVSMNFPMSWRFIRLSTSLPLMVWGGLLLLPPLAGQQSEAPRAQPVEEEEIFPEEEEEDIPEARPVPETPSPVRPQTPPRAPEIIPEARPVPNTPATPARPATAPTEEPGLPASMRTQADARTLYVSLPPPRGLIVDRHGKPFAQNIIAYYPGITFPEGPPMKPADALAYAKARVAAVEKILGVAWRPKDDAILTHYQNRRWLPYLCETVFRDQPPPAQLQRLPSGVIMHPAYLRVYPESNAACHLIGSVGKTRPMPVTPLDPNDPYYPELTARDGLELAFEEKLKGKPGQLNMLFDAHGNKISEEMTQRPMPGDTLVTTLDLDFQKICEDELRQHTKRGAFVIMDVQTGDILALASWPTFDLNLFVPSMSQAMLNKLVADKNKPLRGRAFMDTYPPASTFKVVTALAGLESGKIKESTTFNCGPSYRIGNRYFRNHSKSSYGSLDMIDAIKYSCNTWFYPMALRIGSQELISMSTRLGFGERTGLPIRGEAPGNIPTDEFMLAHHHRKIAAGDLANMSIGQGAVNATPLQVARAMAAIANGEFVPQSRLISHSQDVNNRITEAFPPVHRNELNLKSAYLASVRKGMSAVVNEGGGTGRSASNRYVSTAGKTGTAQWSGGRNMAWFAGFLPVKDPQYAFAAIYEGDYGEGAISGGRKVAPLVADVFNRVYRLKKERSEPMSGRSARLAKNKKDQKTGAEAGDEEASEEVAARKRPRRAQKTDVAATSGRSGRNAPSASTAASTAPAKPKEGGVKGFFKRLFSKDN